MRRPIVALCAAWFCAVLALVAGPFGTSRAVAAVTPESPEVKKLVDSALKFLETNVDERLGGRCLVGLTFLKAGRRDHPRVREALTACRETVAKNSSGEELDNYSNGLAIIFLSELSSKDYAKEIQWFLAVMKKRQKNHGGWGYTNLETGDTSQTQYAALSLWEAHRRGFDVSGASIEQLADWLMRTQGPDGCWGYQGNLSTTGAPVPQSETNCSMLSAGMGCCYICADLFGVNPRQFSPRDASGEVSALPPALRAAGMATTAKKITPQKTDIPKLLSTINRGHGWMEANYKIAIGPKCFYYLYGMERYKSFQEQLEGRLEESPKWYNDGFEFLVENQKGDGSWVGYCEAPCDTAFATLFLLRSTQKSLNAKLGEGTLLSGRGLPTNLSRAKVRNGELIIEQVNTKVDELLNMLDEGDNGLVDDLARDPSQLVVGKVDKQSARRLQQLVRGGEPEVRLVAVRALGRTGDLDYVPSLLYALTDPDPRVVLEARDALKFVSRDFKGYGPPDEFNDQQRADAVNAWKKWYLSLRPTAVLER